MSGHSSETLGPLVIQIGGMRNELRSEDLLHVLVIHLQKQRISRPSLAPESTRPLQRMRHASCVVQGKHLPCSAFEQAILVLGGHCANTRAQRSEMAFACLLPWRFMWFGQVSSEFLQEMY